MVAWDDTVLRWIGKVQLIRSAAPGSSCVSEIVESLKVLLLLVSGGKRPSNLDKASVGGI